MLLAFFPCALTNPLVWLDGSDHPVHGTGDTMTHSKVENALLFPLLRISVCPEDIRRLRIDQLPVLFQQISSESLLLEPKLFGGERCQVRRLAQCLLHSVSVVDLIGFFLLHLMLLIIKRRKVQVIPYALHLLFKLVDAFSCLAQITESKLAVLHLLFQTIDLLLQRLDSVLPRPDGLKYM